MLSEVARWKEVHTSGGGHSSPFEDHLELRQPSPVKTARLKSVKAKTQQDPSRDLYSVTEHF
jgi:hypothetical protein